MEMNTGILRSVVEDKYGFEFKDLIVASMIKAYLQQMKVEEVPEALCRIISPKMRELRGSSIKGRKLPTEQWNGVDKEALALLIDEARAAAAISAMEWQAQEDEKVLEQVIDYLRNDFIPALDGKEYVASMPVEMAEFITDCWLTVA